MPKIDINLDAYRLAAECLFRIRQLMRETLKAAHGDEWVQEGIPEELCEHLSSRRDREASINWHLSESADLLDYTGFANIYDIIAANEPLLVLFSSLAPDPNVLRIRFLELDTILNRIAYVRPVADTEMGFLVSFDERIRRLSAAPAGERSAAAKAATVKAAQKRDPRPASDPVPTESKPAPAVSGEGEEERRHPSTSRLPFPAGRVPGRATGHDPPEASP